MKTSKPKQVKPTNDTLSPEEKKIVRRGEAQLKRGQSKRWHAIKNALPRWVQHNPEQSWATLP